MILTGPFGNTLTAKFRGGPYGTSDGTSVCCIFPMESVSILLLYISKVRCLQGASDLFNVL